MHMRTQKYSGGTAASAFFRAWDVMCAVMVGCVRLIVFCCLLPLTMARWCERLGEAALRAVFSCFYALVGIALLAGVLGGVLRVVLHPLFR